MNRYIALCKRLFSLVCCIFSQSRSECRTAAVFVFPLLKHIFAVGGGGLIIRSFRSCTLFNLLVAYNASVEILIGNYNRFFFSISCIISFRGSDIRRTQLIAARSIPAFKLIVIARVLERSSAFAGFKILLVFIRADVCRRSHCFSLSNCSGPEYCCSVGSIEGNCMLRSGGGVRSSCAGRG